MAKSHNSKRHELKALLESLFSRSLFIITGIKKIDEDSFREDLRTAPWHVGCIFDSIDDQCFYWDSLLKYILDDHAPIKRKRVRKNDVPYMNVEWKEAIRKKRKYAKKFSKNPAQENCEF